MADLHPPHTPPSLPTPTPTPPPPLAAAAASAPAITGAATMESHSTAEGEESPMKCCCGRLDCVFLKHNCAVLDSVEKEVHTAARMGQALLARHEAYMADAERDRRELMTRIEQLEMDNKDLEATNAKIIEENRNLLDQLEALNSTVNDSEHHIKSLEATLLSSQQTIRRLESETARAEALERQVILLEQEQADLQNNLSLTREDARSAVFRWRRAEREINDLQEQLERIEQEARTEREHHEEMMGRIERQREMERELNTAAVRLKGQAAMKSLNYAKDGSNVVSHFVRDLLQDNANLQHGIAELKEMLLNSYDEIQALRDQMAYHQPLGDAETSTASTLRAELESGEPRESSPRVSQEYHVHHHYHVAKPETKKPRKKRLGASPGVFEPSTGSYPATPPNFPARVPMAKSHRDSHWSLMSDQPSDFAPSSVPSSPRSNHRSSSLFDAVHSSFPGSPATSIDPMSPSWRGSHRKQSSNVSTRSFQAPTHFSLAAPLTQTHPIIEETDDGEHVPELTITTDESAADDETSSRDLDKPNDDVSLLLSDTDDDIVRQPRLHRSISQESIISLAGGLDIHTLKSRPSQLTLRLPYNSTASVVASSAITARPMLSRDPAKRSSAMLRDSYDSYATSPASSTRSSSNSTVQLGTSLGKWVGWRPWGGGRGGVEDTPGRTTTAGIAKDAAHKQLSRPPGINQAGAIPGFAEYIAASQKKLPPPKILPDAVDQEALREGLVNSARIHL